jgi:hypothetical protein
MSIPFRHSAGFGRRIEYWIIGKMLKENLDVYVPLVDDFGVDAVIRKKDGTFIEVQIKARSKDVVFGDAALFAAIDFPENRKNYFFIFYSERLDQKGLPCMWILSSEEFIQECVQNKNGKNVGKRGIWFNGKNTKNNSEHPKERFNQNLASDFSRFH